MSGRTVEIEMTFRVGETVSRAEVEAADLGDYRLTNAMEHYVLDTYLDTPDLRISGDHCVLRIRQVDDGSLVTFEEPGVEAGHLRQRDEIELPCNPEDIFAGRLPESIAEALAPEIAGTALESLFTVENVRTTWDVVRGNVLVAEMALDHGWLKVRDAREQLNELEIELKGSGELIDLSNLESRLVESLAFKPETRTTLERGQALRNRLAGPGQRPIVREAAERIRQQSDRLRRAARRVPDQDDSEAAHDLRVAARRLRSFLAIVIDSGVMARRARRLDVRLREVARSAGVLRDSDVLLASLAELPDDDPAKSGMAPKIRQRRRRGERQLLREVHSSSFKVLRKRLGSLISSLEKASEDGPLAGVLLRHRAGSAIWLAYESVLAYEDKAGSRTMGVLHGLRITVKRLRYTVEFFGPALGAGFEDVHARLVALHESLGAIHDDFVAAVLAGELGYEAERDRRLSLIEKRGAQFWMIWPTVSSAEFRGVLGNALRFEPGDGAGSTGE